ncbi:MAG: tetratricopeptide repeat protein [Gemmatimonadota bacterium]
MTGRERESLEIVRSYGAIAPHNPHALHMPTHIFVRLGEWEDAIDWNRRAAAAALDHPAGPEGEYVSSEYTHASAYLVYAYLQRGDDAAAEEALRRVRTTPNLEPDFKAAFDLVSLPARYAWDRFAWPEAVTWFARALGSARLGDAGAARGAVQKLGELRERTAAGGEAATPAPILPARELLGDLLMELDRPGEALAAYEAALDATPGRLNALLGTARAADAAGEPEKARTFQRTIVDGTAGDSPRPGVVEVRERIDARAGD